jgi:uncharacterized protein YegP (UPF0339 family)
MALIAGEMNLGVYQDSAGRYRWRLWSGLRLVAISGESFHDRLDAEFAALCFKVDARDAAFDVLALDDSWYWQARDGGGRPLAIASRRFDSPFNAKHAAAYVSNHVARATFS